MDGPACDQMIMAVMLTEANNGTSVEARQGDEIVVQLRENPTTGFRWHVERVNGILEQETDAYRPDREMRFGSGGVREFRFRGKAAGTARLELKHWQAWEGESSVTDRFRVEIRLTD